MGERLLESRCFVEDKRPLCQLPSKRVGGWAVSLCAVCPLVVFPSCSVWLGLCVGRVDPTHDPVSTGFHDCLQRTVRQPRPTRPRLATGARPSVSHHHPIRPRRAGPTSRPTYQSAKRTITGIVVFCPLQRDVVGVGAHSFCSCFRVKTVLCKHCPVLNTSYCVSKRVDPTPPKST